MKCSTTRLFKHDRSLRAFAMGLAALLVLCAWVGRAVAQAREPEEHGPLRLSAIVDNGLRYLVGLVDTETGRAYLVGEGGKVLSWRVKAIDGEEMSAVLVDADGDELYLVLTGDEDAAAKMEGVSVALRPKTLAEFLAEHPELAVPAPDQAPIPESTNPATTAEDFLAAHPDLAGLTNYVAPELRGPGAMATLTEKDVDLTPVSREEGLRRMAEQADRPMPDAKEITYEDFLRDQGASAAPKPVAAPKP